MVLQIVANCFHYNTMSLKLGIDCVSTFEDLARHTGWNKNPMHFLVSIFKF